MLSVQGTTLPRKILTMSLVKLLVWDLPWIFLQRQRSYIAVLIMPLCWPSDNWSKLIECLKVFLYHLGDKTYKIDRGCASITKEFDLCLSNCYCHLMAEEDWYLKISKVIPLERAIISVQLTQKGRMWWQIKF